MPQTIDNLVATWNNSGTTFTAFKFNVTDTASAAASLLMDLQVGGSSKFKVSKGGNVTLPSGGVITSSNLFYIAGSGNETAVSATVGINGSFLNLASDKAIGWGPSNPGSTPDIYLTRRGIANLRLGNVDAAAPVAQTLSVQSVVAGTTNTVGANFTITGSQGTGTGAGGSIVFQVAPAGSSGTAQNALVNAFKINPTGTLTLGTLQYSGLSFGTGGEFNVDILGTIGFKMYSNGLSVPPATQIGWASGALPVSGSGTLDLILARDAANTLALRNGANAQAFRVYNTYTDASNYERGYVRWSANVLQIGAEKAGTGTDRNITIATGVSSLTLNAVTGGVTVTGFAGITLGSINIYQPSASTINIGGTLLQLGGTTSSFPAIKRSSTTLQARLADDSAFASVQGKLTTDTAYAAGDPTTTGYLVVYDSTGTAYKIPAVAV